MKKLFSKKGITAVIIAAIIAAITGISLILNSNPGIVTNTVETILSPIKTVTASIASVCEKIYGYMNDFDRLLETNAQLRAQLAGSSQEEREFAELEKENERLRELLGLAQRNSDYEFEMAAIINWSSSNWESTFTINKGSANSAIEEGDCVITSAGEVVGVVKTVSTVTSVCISVVDSDFAVSVNLNKVTGSASAKGDYALMKDGLLMLDYINDSNKVLPGDTVITSGKGGVFPDGLLVGYIVEISSDETGLSDYATVEPAADLDNVMDVFVITEFEIIE
ncbi:MAG: rod shape-determining protein MreC [Oscillospiraceae bacterium]|nr:rod shape-determining protein MreC [Oscillospiraceae bacterium]